MNPVEEKETDDWQISVLSIGLKQQDLYIVVKCSRRDEVIEDSPM